MALAVFDAQYVCECDGRPTALALYEAPLRCGVRRAGPSQLTQPWVRIGTEYDRILLGHLLGFGL